MFFFFLKQFVVADLRRDFGDGDQKFDEGWTTVGRTTRTTKQRQDGFGFFSDTLSSTRFASRSSFSGKSSFGRLIEKVGTEHGLARVRRHEGARK